MDNTIQFINYHALNRHILGDRKLWESLLSKWIAKDSMLKRTFIGENPKRSDGDNLSLWFDANSGRWHDINSYDAGPDIISLCAYVHDLSYHKAALRIIEEMRLSHE